MHVCLFILIKPLKSDNGLNTLYRTTTHYSILTHMYGTTAGGREAIGSP